MLESLDAGIPNVDPIDEYTKEQEKEHRNEFLVALE